MKNAPPPDPEPRASWWQQEADGRGFPLSYRHASGALLERVDPCRWQLVFGGKHRTLSGRFAPLDKACRVLPELMSLAQSRHGACIEDGS